MKTPPMIIIVWLKLCLLSSLVVGCGANKPPIILDRLVPVAVTMSPTYLTPCELPVPPDPIEYMDSGLSDRETMLAVYIHELIARLTRCNIQIEGIKKWRKLNLTPP